MTRLIGRGRASRALLACLAVLAVAAVIAKFFNAQVDPAINPLSSGTLDAKHDTPNPGRGQYLWHPDDHPFALPPGTAAVDSYARVTWKEIEPTRNKFDFSPIERQLESAQARGGLFAFRIMAVCSSCGSRAILPDDLDKAARTWTASLDDGTKARVPDWNDKYFLSRWESLMEQLGARYGDDRRLGYLDAGGYGNWGEGHNWPYENIYPGPSDQQEGSSNSQIQMAVSVINNFPNKFVLYNPPSVPSEDGGNSNGKAAWEVLRSVLLTSKRVGIRNDCLGGGSVQKWAIDGLIYAQTQATNENLKVEDRPLDRWRIAPFISEWCNSIRPQSDDGTFKQGLRQVRLFHISSVSNANFSGELTDYTKKEQRDFKLAAEVSGYNLQVQDAAPRPRDGKTELEFLWRNLGVAPTYGKWNIKYTLFAVASGRRCDVDSQLDVRNLIDEGVGVIDAIEVPTACAGGGELATSVTVNSSVPYIRPMRLSSRTENADGSYSLKSLTF